VPDSPRRRRRRPLDRCRLGACGHRRAWCRSRATARHAGPCVLLPLRARPHSPIHRAWACHHRAGRLFGNAPHLLGAIGVPPLPARRGALHAVCRRSPPAAGLSQPAVGLPPL